MSEVPNTSFICLNVNPVATQKCYPQGPESSLLYKLAEHSGSQKLAQVQWGQEDSHEFKAGLGYILNEYR